MVTKKRVCLDPTKLNKAVLRETYPITTVEEVVAKTIGAKYFSVIDADSGYWQMNKVLNYALSMHHGDVLDMPGYLLVLEQLGIFLDKK